MLVFGIFSRGFCIQLMTIININSGKQYVKRHEATGGEFVNARAHSKQWANEYVLWLCATGAALCTGPTFYAGPAYVSKPNSK